MHPSSSTKNIIVTGGARGIGRCIARTLLQSPASHRVYILDIDADELDHCVKTHLKPFYEKNRVNYSAIDLTDPKSVHSAVKKAAEEFFRDKRIDVLVNNAGIARPGWSEGKTTEDHETLAEWNKYLATNLTGPYLLSQAVIPYMKQDPEKTGVGPRAPEGGCIINVSSFRAHFSDPDSEPYGTTKSGLLGLTHSLAVSSQRWNIRVNCVLPGFISVQHESRAGDEGEKPQWEDNHTPDDPGHKGHLVNRVGKGEDIAAAVEYLMGAGFVTGQELIVDGGISIMKERGNA